MRSKLLIGIVLVLFAAPLFGPFLVSVPPLENTFDPVTLADSDSRFVELGELSVHFKEAGQGTRAFILLHGFGASVFTWREVLGSFAELGRTVAYDRPAFGLTQRPLQWSGANPYGDFSQAELAVALLDTLDIDSAVWVANSAGARVAVDVALQHPNRVTALVLVDPAISAGPRWLQPLLHTPQLNHLGPRLVRSIADYGDAGIRRAWHDPTRVTAEVFAGYRKPLQASNWDRALWEFARADRSSTIGKRLHELAAVPTLVITGDDDRIVPTDRTIELAKQIPGSSLVVLPNCGHLPQEECPVPFMAAVRDFLAQQVPDIEGADQQMKSSPTLATP
jgi:pimeloyl-ACP methyl ester carboxylesterase